MNNSHSGKPTARSGQHPGASESPESIETFAQREKRPGQVGLANEARPGLGTRSDEAKKPQPNAKLQFAKEGETPPQPPESIHEPQEQDATSLAQELERDTGVSGHSGGN